MDQINNSSINVPLNWTDTDRKENWTRGDLFLAGNYTGSEAILAENYTGNHSIATTVPIPVVSSLAEGILLHTYLALIASYIIAANCLIIAVLVK